MRLDEIRHNVSSPNLAAQSRTLTKREMTARANLEAELSSERALATTADATML